jgi:hypothetical protein
LQVLASALPALSNWDGLPFVAPAGFLQRDGQES